MIRFTVLLLFCACAVAIQEYDNSRETLAAEVKTGVEKRGSGPRMMMCSELIIERKRYVCYPSLFVEDSNGFLDQGEANSFLASGDIDKRGLTEECCHEGCKWEEVLEHC